MDAGSIQESLTQLSVCSQAGHCTFLSISFPICIMFILLVQASSRCSPTPDRYDCIRRSSTIERCLSLESDQLCFFFFFINLFIYLFLAALGLRCCARAFSSCVAVRGLLTAVASPVVEQRLQACGLSSCGSQAQLLHGMWDLPGPGLEPVSPCISMQILNHCATRETSSV